MAGDRGRPGGSAFPFPHGGCARRRRPVRTPAEPACREVRPVSVLSQPGLAFLAFAPIRTAHLGGYRVPSRRQDAHRLL